MSEEETGKQPEQEPGNSAPPPADEQAPEGDSRQDASPADSPASKTPTPPTGEEKSSKLSSSEKGLEQEKQKASKGEAEDQEVHELDTRERRRMSGEQREMLKAASPYFQQVHFDGDMIFQQGGVQYSSALGPPPVLSPQVSREEIERIWQVYAPPVGYEDAFLALEKRHVLILQGPAFVGKRAAAISMASDLPFTEVNILEIPPEANLPERLRSETIQADTFYLVDGLVAARAEKLKSQDWYALGDRLKEKNSYLVATITDDVRLRSDLSTNLSHRIQAPELGAKELLERHLVHLLTQRGDAYDKDAVRECLEREELKSILNENLTPARIFHLATLLSDYLQDGCKLEDALRRFSSYDRRLVQEWFDECDDDMQERAFRIALAIFDGARYDAVEAAAEDLAELLIPPPEKDEDGKEPPSARKSPFGVTREARLKRARAHIETDYAITDFSDRARVEVVRLDNPGYQETLLAYLWEEFYPFRDILLRWLDEHAGQRSADVRSRAAAAVGALARLDFERIQAKMLYRWARWADWNPDEGRQYRAALSTAMLILIWDDRNASYVSGLLRHWAGQKNISLKWAAVRAYSAVGTRRPQEAMEVWRSVLEEKHRELRVNYDTWTFSGQGMIISTLDAILNLFTGAFEWPERFHAVYEELLVSLHDWVLLDEEPESQSELGLVLFLLMMDIPMPVDEDDSQEEVRPPALLSLIDPQEPQPAVLENLSWLLRKALNDQDTRGAALELLRRWIIYIDRDDNLYVPIRHVMHAVFTAKDLRKREGERLALYLRRWAEHPRQAKRLKTAQQLRIDLGLIPGKDRPQLTSTAGN